MKGDRDPRGLRGRTGWRGDRNHHDVGGRRRVAAAELRGRGGGEGRRWREESTGRQAAATACLSVMGGWWMGDNGDVHDHPPDVIEGGKMSTVEGNIDERWMEGGGWRTEVGRNGGGG